jgi:DNA-binding CsgD family transcriptional regulator
VQAPNCIGVALIGEGLVAGGAPGITLLERSVHVLESTSNRLDLAQALVELGAALRRANRRSDAREPLRRGMELAHHCGATPLAERARQELVACGARPRRPVRTGIDSLTATERRVAELAANGMSNPEIAQALFVSRRTVETHLGHSYAKLDIRSREQLADQLKRAD